MNNDPNRNNLLSGMYGGNRPREESPFLTHKSDDAVDPDELYERRKVEKLKATMARVLSGTPFHHVNVDSQFLALALCAEGWLTAANDIGGGNRGAVGQLTQKAKDALNYPLDLKHYRETKTPHKKHETKDSKPEAGVVIILEEERPEHPCLEKGADS